MRLIVFYGPLAGKNQTCDIIFVILTSSRLTNFLVKRNSMCCVLKKVADKNLPLRTGFFSSATLFLESSVLNFSSPNNLSNESRFK